MANKMRAIHPGEILKGELEELHLSANALSKALNVPANRITAILSERRGITADTAFCATTRAATSAPRCCSRTRRSRR